jgi:hypothetical protein
MKKLLLFVSLILLSFSLAFGQGLQLEQDGNILLEEGGELLLENYLEISDGGTYSYRVIDCMDAPGQVGVMVTGAATIINFTVIRCPGGAFVFLESATLKNSIGISSGDDITIATTKTVTGTSNLFGDAAKAGTGTYTDISGTQWNADPLFVSVSNSHLLPTSPAINAGVKITGLTTDGEGKPIIGNPDIGAYEWLPPTCTGCVSSGVQLK